MSFADDFFKAMDEDQETPIAEAKEVGGIETPANEYPAEEEAAALDGAKEREGEPLADELLRAKERVAEVCLENRGALEVAIRATYNMDGITREREDLVSILNALDDWHDKSAALLQSQAGS